MIFLCPKCHGQIEVKEKYFEETRMGIFCPACGQLFKILLQIEPLELYNKNRLSTKSTEPAVPLIKFESSASEKESTRAVASGTPARTKHGPLKAQDLKELVIKRLTEKEIQLPVLPEIRKKTLHFSNAFETRKNELIKLIQTDQVLAVTTIRLANSFSSESLARIDTLSEAAQVLGTKRIQKAILLAANSAVNSTSKLVKDDGILKRLWTNNLASAMGSRWLAKKLNIENHEKIFMLGLLHNIGKIIILQILSEIKDNNPELMLPKKVVMEFIAEFHSNIGADMLESWNFPSQFVTIVRNHHVVSNDKIIQMLQITDITCRKMGLGFADKNDPEVQKSLTSPPAKFEDSTIKNLEIELKNLMQRITRLLE